MMHLQKTAPAPDTAFRLPEDTPWQKVLHRPGAARRAEALQALSESYYPRHRRRAARLAMCGSNPEVGVAPGDPRPYTRMFLCQDSLCFTCGKVRQAKLAERLTAYVLRMKEPKLITLTYRHTDAPLAEQLLAVKAAFGRFRRFATCWQNVAGGVYSIEAKYKPRTDRWHVHIHSIVDSPYIYWRFLVAAWSHFMPGGENVDIRQVDDRAAAVNEVVKYVLKPQDMHDWPNHVIRTYADATARHHRIQTFGNLHGVKVTQDLPKVSPPDDAQWITYPRIGTLAWQGLPEARDVAVLLAARRPSLAAYFGQRLPDLADYDIDYHQARAPPLDAELPDGISRRDFELRIALDELFAVIGDDAYR